MVAAACNAGAQTDSFKPVKNTSEPGICDFAAAYAKAHINEPLAVEAGRAIKSNRADDGTSLLLDEANGYLFFEHTESSYFKELEMCMWLLPDSQRRYAVRLLDVDKDEHLVFKLDFYDYDDAAGCFKIAEVEGQTEMLENLDLWDGNENLFLPRNGRDIKWGRNNGDEAIGWYRIQPDGSFVLEQAGER